MKFTKTHCPAIILALTATVSLADSHVVEVTDVQLGTFLVINLGAQITGISAVTIQAIGVGGRGFYDCIPPASDGWYDLDLRVCVTNGCIEFPTSNQVTFDVTSAAVVAAGGWQACEGVPSCPLTATVSPHGVANGSCVDTAMEVQAISRLVISITADSIVADDSTSWGGMKALYRSGAGQ